MAKFLLALDQSSSTTGYSIWLNRKLIANGHQTFNDSDYIVRITKLREWLKEILHSLDGDVEVTIEDIQLQEIKGKTSDVGIQTFKKLAHVQGALLTLLIEEKIQYHIVMASSWKHTCGIKGRSREEQKANAQKFVKQTFNIDATQDEADAICLGWHTLESGLSKVGSLSWS